MDKALKHGELATKAHNMAVEHGFWELNHSNEHCMMLVITEIAEMVEADRNGRTADLQAYKNAIAPELQTRRGWYGVVDDPELFRKYVKDTIEDEMADVVIRLYDMAGNIGMDFAKYNVIRYNRDFEKFEFVENAFALVKGLANESYNIERRILFGLQYIQMWAKAENIMLPAHVQLKMAYNATRAPKHGKNY